MLACFDERGRLFVAASDGQNLKKDGLLAQRPRFVRLLEDVDGDGRFDQSTIFADKMTMPEGALWHDGALYIVSAPYLWRLEDIDGDGVADRRDKLLGYLEFDGRANQHGPYMGPNGRLFLTGGHFGVHLEAADGTRAGAGARTAGVFSCTLDGNDVQVVGLGGVNPVEIVFSPEGDMFSTCAIFDSFGGRHDALIHWIPGGLTQKVYGPIYIPDTGVRLPALARWGQVAPAGLMRYRGTAFGESFRGDLFVCQFNSHKVVRVRVDRSGSTFTSRSEDFLVSPSVDFHPTDILEDADGSLVLLDTGGWLSWGCPFSKVAKPHIDGAIYRIRRRGAAVVKDARGSLLDWELAPASAIVTRLDDPRPVVRDRARETLVDRGNAAVPALGSALESAPQAQRRRNAVWTLSRIGDPQARAGVRLALDDIDATVRQAAARSAGMLRDAAARSRLETMLQGDAPSVRRTAATALGQIGDERSVPALLQSLRHETNDDYLVHAHIRALIDIDDDATTARGLAHEDARVRRAALIALDQMPKGRLDRELVAPRLADDDRSVRRLALSIIGRRGWADQVGGLLRGWLEGGRLEAETAAVAGGVMTALAHDQEVQEVMAGALRAHGTPAATRALILDAVAASDVIQLPALFGPTIRPLLSSPEPKLVRRAVATIEAKDTKDLDEELRALSRDPNRTTALRLAAIAVVARHGHRLEPDEFQLLMGCLDARELPVDRLKAARALAGAKLVPAQQVAVVGALAHAGPLETPVLVGALENPERLAIEVDIAAALSSSPGLLSLGRERVELLLERYPPRDSKLAATVLKRFAGDEESRAQRLAELTAQLGPGDATRGKTVFARNATGCSTCHHVAADEAKPAATPTSVSALIGPDLTRIGSVRRRPDLLEAIVFPSSTIVNGYESYQVVTVDGQVYSGVITASTVEAVELATGADLRVRIRRERIQALTSSAVSIMPRGLDGGMTLEQLADLLAFLESLR